MRAKKQNKIVVLLSPAEHAELKRIAKSTRRTLGQELAFRAFEQVRQSTATPEEEMEVQP